MLADDIFKFSDGTYAHVDTGKEVTKEEIEAFEKKQKVDAGKLEAKLEEIGRKQDGIKKTGKRNKKRDQFMADHKQHIMDLLGKDEEGFEDLCSPQYDIDDLVYRFSTALFDCFNSRDEEWLDQVRDQMGKKFYYAMIDGFVRGRHDT